MNEPKTPRRQTMLRRMLTVSFLLILPAILLPVLITADFSRRATLRRTEQQTLESFRLAERRINELLSSVNSVTYRLDRRDCIYDYLFPRGRASASIHQEISARREIVECMRETMNNNSELGGVLFIREDGPVCGVTLTRRVFDTAASVPSAPFEPYAGSHYTVHWLGLYPQQYFIGDTDSTPIASDYMVFGFRSSFYSTADPVSDPRSRRVTVLFAVTQDALLRCYDQIADSSSSVFLLDGAGQPLVVPPAALPAFSSVDREAPFSSFRAELDGTDCQVIAYRLELTGWFLVKTVPYAVYHAATQPLIVTALISGAAALTVLALLLTFWARRFCAPIKEVTNSLSRVQNGDLSLRLPENANTQEALLLERQFNRMLDSLNELLAQRAEDERVKLALEMRSLQTQITPHFIYNTITSIRFTAQMRGDDVVANMLISLIHLLRPIFSEWTPEWTLAEELAFSEHYMTLMRMRYGDRIRFSVDDPGALADCLVPRFTLQPVLENCCEHTSIADRPPLEVRIHLRADTAESRPHRTTGPALVLTVEDNGDGIPADRLAELERKLRSSDPEPASGARSGIGLCNVHRRIQINYGPEYGLCISSVEGEGTAVELWLKRRF